MVLVYQRVKDARVQVDGQTVGEIGAGALLLVGVRVGDTQADAKRLADKTANLRVFEENGKFNLSLLDIGGAALAVSNFTLLGNCRHGRRPELLSAARPEEALPLFEAFVSALRAAGVSRVETGVFGADMEVSLTNDGPVTLVMDTADWT